MDDKWRSGQRDGTRPYKKSGGGSSSHFSGSVESSEAAEDLAEYILGVLARDPDALEITRQEFGPGRSRLQVKCDPGITGRLIGKGGKTITALRLLTRSIANWRGKRVDIEVS